MKFIIDSKIPFINGVLEPFGSVHYVPGNEISPEIINDADVLIIRTRTQCNEHLLAGSSVKFIATATIGYDHIDAGFCKKAGITWVNAPGCNSVSVMQYIIAALLSLAARKGFQLAGKTIGIVGVGQVGSKVAKACSQLGMNVLLNDPPRERAGDAENFSSLRDIQEKADIITFHVPLSLTGDDYTFHLADKRFFESLQKQPVVINTSRGEIFDTSATISAIQNRLVSGVVIDCWENEPDPNPELLQLVDIATPHIAGYSKDGKANATQLCVQAVSRYFGLGIDNWQPEALTPPLNPVIEFSGSCISEEDFVAHAVLATYDIDSDDKTFRENPSRFENLRNNYPVRREFTAYKINPEQVTEKTAGILAALGFKSK